MEKRVSTFITIFTISTLSLSSNLANAQLRDRSSSERIQPLEPRSSTKPQNRSRDSKEENSILQHADSTSANPGISPARRLDRQSGRPPPRNEPAPAGFRNIDGSGNNVNQPAMGMPGSQLQRSVAADYADGVSAMSGGDRPGARVISNVVNAQSQSIPNRQNASDFVWQWGQFVDHDIDLTDGAEPAEPVAISVPTGDLFFDPNGTGVQSISFNRSIYDTSSGTGTANPRQQTNEVTAWIDASNVYGSDGERAAALRSNDGSGKLRSSAGNLLPFNTDGLSNAGGNSDALFLAGDVRANEQVGLTAMHTLFMREHNRLAERILRDHPDLSGDDVYHRARRTVGAQMQVITYKEYLPALLGRNALRGYRSYRANVDASIGNLFSTAVYRYGHSALSPSLLRLDARGREINEGSLALRDAFFAPQRLVDEGGIEPIFRGLASQICQEIDPFVIDDVRNFLFGPPGSGGFDLAALNIQRGRDHGLPSYNDTREAFGLLRKTSFNQISSNPIIRQRLSEAYASVEDIDVWVGGLAEDARSGAMVGELISAALIEQFTNLRDGDRFWYQNVFNGDELRRIDETRLSDIIRRNTAITGNEIQENVFKIAR